MRKLLQIACAWLLLFGQVHAQGVGNVPAWNVVGNPSASAAPMSSASITSMLDGAFCPTNGAVLQRGASVWACQTAISGSILTANTVPLSALPQGAANTTLCNPTNATANFQACTAGQLSANLCQPVVHVYTATASSPYTIDQCNGVNAVYLEFEAVGGGAGPPGSGSTPGTGNNGNASTITYNSVTYTAGAGQTASAGNNQFGGAGGAVSGCDENIIGGQGGPSQAANASNPGTYGGGTTLAGPTSGGLASGTLTGQTGPANSGAGGGGGAQGGAVASSPGGGGGGTCRKLVATVAGQNSVSFVVGAAVAGGTLGATGGAGGGGAAGRVKITARWQ